MSDPGQPSRDSESLQSAKTDSPIIPQWLIRFIRPSRMLWLAPLLGCALSLPFIFLGYCADDHLFKQQVLEKSAYYQRAAWDYFNWSSSDAETAGYRERGIIIDWLTPDAFRFRPFRPISSLVHAVEFRYFGTWPWMAHVGLALLYALLIYIAAKLLMRFSISPVAIGIGILIFAIDDIHAYSSGCIMSLNTLLCCIFGLFALLMYDRWRRDRSVAGLLLFVTAYPLALLSSEGGVATMAYVLAYALFIESGTWKRRLAALAPGVAISICYLGFYASQHFGPKCFTAYLSVADDPWVSILAIASNTVLFSLSQILSLPPVTVILQLAGISGVLAAGALLGVLVLVFQKSLLSNKRAAFYGAGMVLSIVPFTLGFVSDRLLLWAGLGGAGLLAELFVAQSTHTAKVQRIFARVLLATNTLISLIFFVPLPFMFLVFDSQAKMVERCIPRENTVLLNAAEGFWPLYSPAIRYEKGGEWPEHFYSLYKGTDTLTITRTADRSFLATTPKGWISSDFEKSRRPKQLYFNSGDTIDLHLMTAVIESVTADKRPLSVRFTFKRDLSEFTWMKWTGKEPQKCDVPAIGEQMRLRAPGF